MAMAAWRCWQDSGKAVSSTSLRANRSRERAPDDKLREAIHRAARRMDCFVATLLAITNEHPLLPDHRWPLVRHRHVEHAQLHALGALPSVDRERSRDMQRLAAMRYKRVAEFLPDRPERDAVHNSAVAGFEPHAQMRLPDFVVIDQLVRRQRDHRLGIAAAEWSGAIERRRQFGRYPAGADGAVDEQFIDVARGRNVIGQRAFHIGAEFGELLLTQGDARGHGVAAALEQQTVMHRLPDGLAEIDAADRAARAGADPPRLERNGKRRPREFFLQPRCDEADHAGMPAFRRGDDHRTLVLRPERSQRLGFGPRLRHLLDDAAFAIEAVEFGGDPSGF